MCLLGGLDRESSVSFQEVLFLATAIITGNVCGQIIYRLWSERRHRR